MGKRGTSTFVKRKDGTGDTWRVERWGDNIIVSRNGVKDMVIPSSNFLEHWTICSEDGK